MSKQYFKILIMGAAGAGSSTLHQNWVVSGVLCNWGNFIIRVNPSFKFNQYL